MNEEEIPAPISRHISLLWISIPAIVLVICGVGIYFSWKHWQFRIRTESENQQAILERIDTLQHVTDQSRETQRTTQQTLQDIGKADRALRDQLLELEQRHALLEQHVNDLSKRETNRLGELRQNEAESLLRIGQERLTVADDLDGARRAYALAAETLQNSDTVDTVAIQQVLNQERHALDRLRTLPVQALHSALDAFADKVDHLSVHDPHAHQQHSHPAPWWQRFLTPIFRIERTDGAIPLHAVDRFRLKDAITMELTVARLAIERHDVRGFQSALQRVDASVRRLWPPSPSRTDALTTLHQLQHEPLSLHIPELGKTLALLQSQRLGHQSE